MIDIEALIEQLNESRFDNEVAEERRKAVSSLAHIIAAEVNGILSQNNMPAQSAFAHKVVNALLDNNKDEMHRTISNLVMNKET